MLRHLPNLVTASRGVAGLVVAALLIGPGWHFVAFWVFVGAIVTDLVDGWLARRLKSPSSVGEWLDPLSDKLLTDVTWLACWWMGYAPGWLALVIIARDLLVGLGWVWAAPRGLRWRPSPVGQIMVAYEGTALSIVVFHGPWNGTHWPSVGTVLGTVALLLSLVSLAQYALQGPRPAGSTLAGPPRDPGNG